MTSSEKQSLLANDALLAETALESDKFVSKVNADLNKTRRRRRRITFFIVFGLLAAGVWTMHLAIHAWHHKAMMSIFELGSEGLFEVDLNTEFWRDEVFWRDYSHPGDSEIHKFTPEDMEEFPDFPVDIPIDFASLYRESHIPHPDAPQHDGHDDHIMHKHHGHHSNNDVVNMQGEHLDRPPHPPRHHPKRPHHPPHGPPEDFIVYRPSNGNFTLTPEEYAELVVFVTGDARTAGFLIKREPSSPTDNIVSGEIFFVVKNDTDTDSLSITYSDNEKEGEVTGFNVNITTPRVPRGQHLHVLTIIKISVPESKELDSSLESIALYAGSGLINSTISSISNLTVAVGAGIVFVKELEADVVAAATGLGRLFAVKVSADKFYTALGHGSSFALGVKANTIAGSVFGGNLTIAAELKGDEAELKAKTLHGRTIVAVHPSFSGTFDVRTWFGKAELITHEDDVETDKTKWPGGHISGRKGDGDQDVSLVTKFGNAVLFIGKPHHKDLRDLGLGNMGRHGCEH